MYEKGKTPMVDAEMKRYNISLLGITQTRYIKSGTFRLATGETRLNSGHTHDRVLYTTGRSVLKGWEAVSSRLITATFRTTTSKDTHQIYDVYAPTNDASEEVKDQFYERLKNVLQLARTDRKENKPSQWETWILRLKAVILVIKKWYAHMVSVKWTIMERDLQIYVQSTSL